MSKFTKEMVDSYADKLLIGLTEEENRMVLDEFDAIDKDLELVTKIPNIEKVEPMVHTLDYFYYELRKDVIEESIPVSLLLSNCDDICDNEVVVPRVLK